MRIKTKVLAVAVFLVTSFITAVSSYAGSSVFPPYESFNRINTDQFNAGTINIKAELTFDAIFKRLGDGWFSYPDITGLNNYFNYDPVNLIDGRKEKWTDSYGQTLLLNFGIKPTEWFFAELGFQFIGDYAERYWIPVNNAHRMDLAGKNVPRGEWTNARIGILGDWYTLTYYKNYLHMGWKYDGDMFDMLPAQDFPDDYLRYSGHFTPDYWRGQIKGFWGDLTAIYGDEVVQDYKHGIYVKYSNIFGSGFNFYYSDHIIDYGTPDERMRNLQLNREIKFLDTSLQLGVLYRPFRLGWDYNYVENVGLGNGYLGTEFNVKTGKTDYIDAFGGSAKWSLNKKFGLDLIKLGAEYRGLVAGNRWKLDASVEKALSKYVNTYLGYYYQKPLLAAMPLRFSAAGGGPIAIKGRGPESPFWVWWNNPLTGFDNRETSAFKFVFTYDPTPSTWWYQFEPNNPTASNLNPEEDAPFSFAVKAEAKKFWGTLDRQVYWDPTGETVWEWPQSNGTEPPDRYIGSLYVLTQFNKGPVRILYDFEIGEDLAGLNYAYQRPNPSETFINSIIGYLKTSITVDFKPYLVKAAYYRNSWGPEDWHKNFGSTFDELYLAHVSRDIGEWFQVGVEYAGGRKTDRNLLSNSDFFSDITHPNAPDNFNRNELGTFDELRVYFKVFFDATLTFGSKDGGMPFKVEADKTAPTVALKVHPDAFYPADGETATLEPYAADFSGIDEWNVYIKDKDGIIVKKYTGSGEPPEELIWDGKDEVTGKPLPPDTYYATLEAYDNYGNYAITDPLPIKILARAPKVVPVAPPPPPPPAPEQEPAAPKIQNTTIKETERGLVISLGAKVLFDTDKYNLKSGAIKTLTEVANLLKKYPDNNISIEGHTDWVGPIEYNQKLSENRAKSVKNFLVRQGVPAGKIQTVGYGKLRPIASNETPEGREQNRRVEIVVLNNAIVVEPYHKETITNTTNNSNAGSSNLSSDDPAAGLIN